MKTIVFTVKTENGITDVAITGNIFTIEFSILDHNARIFGNNIAVSEPSDEGFSLDNNITQSERCIIVRRIMKTPNIW